jgi:hypothetical protein
MGRFSIDQHFATIGTPEAREQPQERAFAAAVRSNESGYFSGADTNPVRSRSEDVSPRCALGYERPEARPHGDGKLCESRELGCWMGNADEKSAVNLLSDDMARKRVLAGSFSAAVFDAVAV